MTEYTVTTNTTVYWFLVIYLRGCMFQPKVGYLHGSIKRQIAIVYVEVSFSNGAFRAGAIGPRTSVTRDILGTSVPT